MRLLGGRPILVHAVAALAAARSVDLVIVAAPSDRVAEVRDMLGANEWDAEVRVVPGGSNRQESVALALGTLPESVDVVLVHDAARPLVPVELVDAVVAAVRSGVSAVVPAMALTETIKSIDEAGRVVATIDRETLRAVQTPQGFDRAVLVRAHAAADPTAPATDDAGLVERIGVTVLLIPGNEEAFKVTRPTDLLLAESVLARRRADRAV